MLSLSRCDSSHALGSTLSKIEMSLRIAQRTGIAIQKKVCLFLNVDLSQGHWETGMPPQVLSHNS
jgi:hypothetical protein